MRKSRVALALAPLAACVAATAVGAAEIEGTVTWTGPAAVGADLARGTVVYFEPQADASPPPPVSVEIRMVKKEFVPRVAVVPVGSTVHFPNLDPILHNVFSVSPGNAFDLGLYRRGEGEVTTVTAPGLVRVFCNVHHAMVAYVLVLTTPHHTFVGPDGSFRLSGVPPGPGTLTAWSDRASPGKLELTAGARARVSVELTADREAVPPHTNKRGKPYPRSQRVRAY